MRKKKNANTISQRHIVSIPSKAQAILRYRSQAKSFSLQKLLVTMVKESVKIHTKVQKTQKNIMATQKRQITRLKFFHDQKIPGIGIQIQHN